MPNGHHSDDSIEPTTPPTQRLHKDASPPRILCLDSSPVIASHPTMSESSNFRSAMSSGNGSSMSRTSFTTVTPQSSYVTSKSTSVSSSKAPTSFKSSLEQFRFGGSSTIKRQNAASDKSSDLSDPESSAGEDRKPKKRRLVRGGARSPSRHTSEERESAELKQTTLKESLNSQSDGNDDDVREVPPPSARNPTTAPSQNAKSSTTAPPSNGNAPISDEELRAKARLIIKEKPLLDPRRVIAALRQTCGDVSKSIQLLTSRPSAVTTKTVSLKPASNGLRQPASKSIAPHPGMNGIAQTSKQASSISNTPSSRASTPALSHVSSQTTTMSLAPQPVKRQHRETVEISSGDDDGDDQDREEKQERAAVKWFNTADANALIDTTNCNALQAETIIALRPFDDAEDIEDKLGSKSAKGVTPRLFHHCKDLMAGYYEVDEVLARCEKIGKELSDAMASWLPDASQSASGLASPAVTASVNASLAGSREGTPASTLNLSSIKKGGSSTDKFYLEEQPKSLAKGVKLKDYQLVGVNWLNLLYRKKTSCILADEMGLGKTAQVIAFFAQLKEIGIRGPHLVVAPSSVLENWDREFRFFAPSIHVRKYYGSMKDRVELREELTEDPDLEVILTTYDMAAGGPADHSFLRKFGRRGCGRNECKPNCDEAGCRTGGFEVCVFDEGHMLKNRKSQKYDKLLKLKTRWRLLLTGTPLQNNLQELVSLLNFIMPEYFSDAEEALAAIFKVKAGGQQNQLSKQRVDRAKKMMHPFVLRRLKDKVLTDLTTKTVRVEYCDMTPAQRKIYAQAVARTKRVAAAEAESAKATTTTRSKKVSVIASTKESGHVLMELRKAANHPLLSRRLFDEPKIDAMARDLMKEPDYADYNFEHVKEDLRINTDAQLSFSAQTYPATRKHILPAPEWMNSGKIQALQRLIPEIQAKGDRILIFSQFTMVLDILCVCLEHMGVKYVGFTGSTQVEDRQVLVDQFTNDPSITVFLLSTKAGGLGINLIAANWVILFDQDFNPHNDKQAADRSYRMGQTKPVTVVKLLSRGTIDEDIHALGERKLELADRVSGEDDTESDEAEQKKVAQTLLAKLREAASSDITEISDDDDDGEQRK
ncbi:related to FUN30 - protein important for chromosome integrity and segregation [Melanopsichium pennsylvanicum]|uniref:DNA helicase n=2 Tax=Melanopsichium pennsylvanicum TaxID=63383 RepID=A0AAJ4XMQ8_9BASI|nr:related to FUN30-protein important for chromosome integrity and segregation [Melanopsichium pennsylvanicum 4]SNX84741.1 related to FUN30 - protein important for chromosome integrity and segregation [Melanopsichium pennsylvanicum]